MWILKKPLPLIFGVTAILIILVTVWFVVNRVNKSIVEKFPFESLNAGEVEYITIDCIPPNNGLVKIYDRNSIEEVVAAMRDVVVYDVDESARDYAGQYVEYILYMESGEMLSFNPFGTFIQIDGVYYETKYEPSEELNAIANTLFGTSFARQNVYGSQLSISSYPNPYTPLMSVSPGMRMEVAYGEPYLTVRYQAESGSFISWEGGDVTELGKKIIASNETPVYWRPNYDANVDDIVTVTILRPIGQSMASSFATIVLPISFDSETSLYSIGEGVAHTESEENRIIPKEAPLLDIRLLNGEMSHQRIQTAQLTTDWYVVDENGDGFGYNADSPHPLQLHDYHEITLYLNGIKSDAEMLFSDGYQPNIVSVQRWDAKYIGSEDYSLDIWNRGEQVEVDNMRFFINSDYVYQISASWDEGNSNYAFLVVNDTHNKEEPTPSMSIIAFTADGLTFVLANESLNEYTYGEDYSLFVLKENEWEPVEPIIENWGFNSIGFILMPESRSEETAVDWRWLFGELPTGKYKFQKRILYVRSPGDYDVIDVSQEFTLL